MTQRPHFTNISVFDEKGNPVEVPPEVRATLSQDQQIRLNVLQEAARAEHAATAEHAVALKALHKAVRERDQVSIDRDAQIPRLTQQDLLRQMGMNH